MNTQRKNRLSLIVLSLSVLSVTGPTWAGSVKTDEVFVGKNAEWAFARGSMVSARDSADTTQYIGCMITGQPDIGTATLRCFARDRAGNNAFCLSLDKKHVAQLQGMTDSSYISFAAKRTTGNCDNLHIHNYSYQLK